MDELSHAAGHGCGILLREAESPRAHVNAQGPPRPSRRGPTQSGGRAPCGVPWGPGVTDE